MDTLVQQLLAFPPHPTPKDNYGDAEFDADFRKFLESLSKIPAKKLTQEVSEGQDLLDVLDPSRNTLPYLHVLLAQITGSGKGKQSTSSAFPKFQPDMRLWTCMLNFVHHFDPIQIRYAGSEFRYLLQNVEVAATSSFKFEQAVLPLTVALRRLDPSGATLTSLHVLFARLCLRGRLFREATIILDQKIRYFPSTSDKASSNPLHPYACSIHDISSTYITIKSGLTDKIDYRDHLKYHLHGAIMYMALKEWEKALLFLEIVLFTPTNNTASLIQVEAYRKWVLICLIVDGKRRKMPTTTSSQAIRLYHSLARAYDGLAEVFEKNLLRHENASKLVKECQVGQRVWSDDCNTGLVQQVVEAYRRFSVIKLGTIFAAMPLSVVANYTSQTPQDIIETSKYLSDLISGGHLNAVLEDAPNGSNVQIMRFLGSSFKSSSAKAKQDFAELLQQVDRIQGISNQAQLLDRELGVSRECIQSAKKERAAAEHGVTNGMNDLMTGDTPIEEDIMEDL